MKRVDVHSYPVSIFMAGDALEAMTICKAFCDQVGLCVTLTNTAFVYTGGGDVGFIVGLINYPRFPKEPDEIFALAERLAADLCDGLKQQSYSIQAPDKTVWISHRPADAQGIEARQGGNGEAGAVHESPTPLGDAPETLSEDTTHDTD
jgi:hypothetical protein